MLSVIAEYWASIAGFFLFGVLHSLGAQEPFKEWLARLTGRLFVDHFWRIVYCTASYAALYHIIGPLHWGRHPDADLWLIDYPDWLWQAMIVLHLLSIAFIYLAFLQSDYLEFWGVKQAWRGFAIMTGRRVGDPGMSLFGADRLVVGGLYGWVRHPMLCGGLLFLLTSGPSKNNLAFVCIYTTYMLIGAYYEERRLVRIFGDQYRAYRQRVGAFVPKLRRGRGRRGSRRA